MPTTMPTIRTVDRDKQNRISVQECSGMFRNPPPLPPTGLIVSKDCGKLPISEEEDGLGVGEAQDGSVGDRSRFRHSVLDEWVHFFTSSSPALHLQIDF